MLFKIREALQGHPGFPQAVDLPLRSPQTEIAVWLYGLGEPRDITECHSVACPVPFTLCVGFEENEPEPLSGDQRLSLRFLARTGNKDLLGEIELRQQDIISIAGAQLYLFRATACTNLCLPRLRRWTRLLYTAGGRWKHRHSGNLQVSALDSCCNEVIFICPRPVVLVSLFECDGGNIFPMNLMGKIGREHFGFALNRNNQAAPSVGALGQLALSTVPFEKAEQVRQLGKNHRQNKIDWDKLSFTTHTSPTLGIPVPDFALTVCEMKLQKTLPLGSHTFFIARIISKTVYSNSPEFHRIHGLYAPRRGNQG